MNPPSQLLELLSNASLRGSLMVVLLLLLRPWLRRTFGSGWVSLLWLVVLVRLLVPWSAESSWSPFRHWSRSETHASAPGPWKMNVTVRAAALDPAAPPLVVSEPVRSPSHREAWLFWIWAAGSLAALSYFSIRSWRTHGVLRRAYLTEDARLQRVYATIPSSLRTRAALRVTEDIPVAALVGIWRPSILLPREWLAALNDEELRHVLLHELGHARRGDLVVQWLFAFAQCLHWFNPFVWLAARGARLDAELACDAWVLAHASDADREGYGETLLKTSQLFRSHLSMSPAAIGMAANRETLVTRVRQVSAFRPVARWQRVIGMTFLVVAAALLMTHRTEAQAPAESVPTAPPTSSVPTAPPAPTTEEAKPNPESKAPSPAPESPAKTAPEGKAKPPATPKRQIEIEAKFLEVTESAAKKLGLVSMPSDWESSSGGARKAKGPSPVLLVNSILREADLTSLLQKLNKTKGTDLLSAPRVTTITGQRAVIEIIREFRYPTEFDLDKSKGIITPTAFETRNLGVTMEVEPLSAVDGVIDLTLVPQIVELEGFMRAKDARPVPLRNGRSIGANMNIKDFAGVNYPKDDVLQPIFSERKITTSVSMKSGTTMLLGGLRRDTPVEGKPPLSFYLYIFITARIVEHPGALPRVDAAPLPPQQSAIDTHSKPLESPPAAEPKGEAAMPVGQAVPNKPGFIISPFAPKSGYIDVRGFPAGTEIKCPYTGKIFQIP
ncbi:MAG TPA: M56 family metallopeptidase [Chthoniobacter sp.]|nr:M56 family metallopeptidase [Chthoniobacter sp.]